MSLRDEAYQRIRQRIISLEMPPGSTIDEAELQSVLGLGRTPIREAIRRSPIAGFPAHGPDSGGTSASDAHRHANGALRARTHDWQTN